MCNGQLVKSGKAWVETSHEGRRDVDSMTTNMHAKCACLEHVEMAGVHMINQLSMCPCTEPKLGARHRKERRMIQNGRVA